MKRSNPRPPEWDELPPDTPYACDAPHVGDEVPGRAGGVVVGCATPSRARPSEGQYRLDSLGPDGKNVRKSRVRKTLSRTKGGKRRRRRCDHQRDALLSASDLDQARATRPTIPYAVELEFPHEPGESRSCALHPKWREFNALVEAMADRYREDTGDEPDAETLAAWVRGENPELWRWASGAYDAGMKQWEDRVARRAHVTGRESAERTRGRRTSEARRRGIDTTSKGYRDDVLHGRDDVYVIASNPSAREVARKGVAGAKALARRASPHVRRAAVATARGAKRAAVATGRAVKRGAKRAAPHLARGLRGVAGRLDAFASNPSGPFRWVQGGYGCTCRHRTIQAAANCAANCGRVGDVEIVAWG